MQSFEKRLSGGHPNSLGNTLEVVDEVLEHPTNFEALFNCYFSQDEIVRLRVSNAMKRILKADSNLLIPNIERLLTEIAQIDQASTQWTLATLFEGLDQNMSQDQLFRAKRHLEHNLATHQDWIVLNTTMDTLCKWAKSDQELRDWIKPHLERISKDERKSVSKKATTTLKKLFDPS